MCVYLYIYIYIYIYIHNVPVQKAVFGDATFLQTAPEEIRWTLLEPSCILLLCDKILASFTWVLKAGKRKLAMAAGSYN